MKQIGKGSFSTVYQKNSNTVLIKSDDYVKECLSFNWHNKSKYIPNITKIDRGLYKMKLYPKCTKPKQQLNTKAYDTYLTLKKLFNNIVISNKYNAYDIWYKTFSNLKDNTLKNCLLNILDSLSNYGSDIYFEISPRNISFTKSGNLILLDCFFFKTQLDKKNK